MNITKAAQVTAAGIPTAEQLEKLNCLTKSPLTAQQVYVFSLQLCDDQPDRDYERFDTASLPRLAELFYGKTGVIDHDWSAEKQISRIFDTQVVTQNGVTAIKAWAYMLRTKKQAAIIEEIEAGIKKEVSVGCSMETRVCSVCGAPYGSCAHRKGETYDGAVCCAVLCGALDAYEFSFVAVPAQKQAGVLKAFEEGKQMTLKQVIAQADEGVQKEYEHVQKLAQLGQEYEASLRGEIVRLSLLLELGMDEPVLRAVTEKLDAAELKALKTSLTKKTDALFPAQTQLPQAGAKSAAIESEYLI